MSCSDVGLEPSQKKDPDAKSDYEIDWVNRLVSGETIANSVWLHPYGVTLSDDVISGTKTKVWIEGGVCGEGYRITNRITTSGGRTYDMSFLLLVEDT